jgi:uncharacterized membrane protein
MKKMKDDLIGAAYFQAVQLAFVLGLDWAAGFRAWYYYIALVIILYVPFAFFIYVKYQGPRKPTPLK